jgi:hypothetical protein
MIKQLLHLISTKEITLLKELDKLIHIDKQGKFKYKNIPSFQLIHILNFINRIDDDSIYTIIPMLSMFGKDDDPYIIISKQLLVSRFSSSELIHDYLYDRMLIAIQDFGIENLENGNKYYLVFKYKKIILDFSRVA